MRGSGEFKNGLANGTLIISYQDESYFGIQEYMNGKREGFGRHYQKKNDKLTLIFKGHFRNDKFHGPGY